MSAPTLVRLLQMIHPQESPSPRSGTRLSLAQVERLHQRQEGLVNRVSRNDVMGNTQSQPSFGLGFRSSFQVASDVVAVPGITNYDFLQATWGGDLFGTGRTDYVHFTYLPEQGPPQSMSVAYSTNCEVQLQTSVGMAVGTQAVNIFNAGGWDNDVDLFPVLDLD